MSITVCQQEIFCNIKARFHADSLVRCLKLNGISKYMRNERDGFNFCHRVFSNTGYSRIIKWKLNTKLNKYAPKTASPPENLLTRRWRWNTCQCCDRVITWTLTCQSALVSFTQRLLTALFPALDSSIDRSEPRGHRRWSSIRARAGFNRRPAPPPRRVLLLLLTSASCDVQSCGMVGWIDVVTILVVNLSSLQNNNELLRLNSTTNEQSICPSVHNLFFPCKMTCFSC